MKIKLTVLLVLLAPLAKSQLVITSFSQALDLARKQNRELLIAQERNAIDRFNQKSSTAVLIPQVKSITALDYNFALPTQLIPAEFLGGRPGEYRTVQFGTTYNFTTGLEASVPLVNTSLWFDARIAKLNTQASAYNLKNTNYETEKVLAKAYYACLVSLKAKELSALNLSISDSLYQNAKIKFENGLMEQLDLNRLYNSYIQVSNMHEQNVLAYEKNMLGLRYLLAVDSSTQIVLEQTISAQAATVTTLTANADNFPSVKMKMLMLEQSRLGLKKDKWKYAPEINLYARYQAQAQRNDFNFFDTDKSWYNIGVAGLRIDWPLFTGFNRNNAVKRSQQKVKIAEMELAGEKQKVENDNAEIMLSYAASAKALGNNQQSLEMAQQNIDIATAKYAEKVFTLDQFLNVYNESINTQITYLRSLSDFLVWQTIVELKNKL